MSDYNFNPELTKRIRKYKDFKIFPGGHKDEFRRIRWLLEDEKGNTIGCDKCGNIANLCLLEIHGRYLLSVPICKGHARELMESDEDYKQSDLLFFRKSEVSAIKALRKEN